jgi:phage shock protein A
MRRAVILVSVVVVAALLYGCGARVEVAKDKVKARIDSLLGTMDVKRKEIEIGITGLKEGIDGLRKAKIKAQVATEQLGRQSSPQEEKLAAMDNALKVLRGHLAGDKPVEIAGKSYSPQELKELADRVLQARKACSGQVEAFHESQARLQKVVATLERKQHDAEGRLTQIEGQLTVIDSNRLALTALQQSAEAMGENDGSLTKGLDNLQGKVNGLFADVEIQLRCEDAKWADTATKEIDSVEATVARLQDSHDMVAEIDKILDK